MSRTRIIALLLALAAAALYTPVVGFGFVDYDDDLYVTENRQVQQGWSWEGLRWAWTSGRASNWHPLTWLSHMTDVALFGLDPAGHHATNLLLHALNTLLLYLLLERTTRQAWPALLVAALFALHPVQVECVAWVAQRKSLLSASLGLASALAYVAWTSRGGVARYLLAAILLALGLTAKPMLVSLPLLFLLLDLWPLDRLGHLDRSRGGAGRRRAPSIGQLLFEKLPFFALAAASSVATLAVQRAGGAVRSVELLPLGPRLGNAALSYVRYLRKLVWPDDLAILYQHPYLPGGEPLARWQIAGALALLIAACALVAYWFRRGWPVTGWCWFLVTLLPVIGLVQVGTQALADRYLYLASIGPFLLAAWGGASLLQRRSGRARAVALAAVVALLGALAGCTWQQQRFWRDSRALFQRGLAVSPDNPTLHYNLGTVLEKQGRFAEAQARYRRALEIQPQSPRVRLGLANALAAGGRPIEAIDEYETALRGRPDPLGQFNLANALRSVGRTEEAATHYRKALALDPGYAQAYNNLGTLLLDQGSLDEATRLFENGLSADPQLPDLQNNLGVALVRAGRWAEALPRFEAAARLAPAWAAPRISAAWILAASPARPLRDAGGAERLAREALRLAGDEDPAALDALAMAYASAGRFDQAARAAAQAADLASRDGRETLAGQIRERLSLYRRGIPFVLGR
jgi:tetratricopeptide (TPR) repeat protein